MTFTQQVHVCPEHDNCTVIICLNDDTNETVWASHDHNTVPPAERINPDHPAEDHTDPDNPVPIDPAPPART